MNSARVALAARCLAFTSAALALLVLFAAFFYAQPTADDFMKASRGRIGIFAAMRHCYFADGGRWSTAAMQAALFSRFPLLDVYPALLLASFTFLSFAVYQFFSAITRPLLPSSLVAQASLLLMLILWTTVPHPGDSFYWTNGDIEYLVNAGFALLFFASLSSRAPSLLLRVGSILLAVYLGGSHELIMLAVILLLIVGALYFRHIADPRWRTWLGFALLITVFLILLITSPGAAARATRVDGNFRPLAAITLSAGRFITLFPSWLLRAPVILATLWIVSERRLVSSHIAALNPTPRTFVFGIALWLAIPAFTLSLPAFALGGYVPPRALTLACLEFLIGWFLLVVLAAGKWDIPAWFSAPSLHRIRPILPAVLCAALLYSPTCQSTARALFAGVPAWSQATHSRYLDLQRQAASGQQHAIALPLPPTPPIYFDFLISKDPQHFPNRSAARYFGLDTITLASPSKP